eukprot:289210-Prymnesium_polylepis.2
MLCRDQLVKVMGSHRPSAGSSLLAGMGAAQVQDQLPFGPPTQKQDLLDLLRRASLIRRPARVVVTDGACSALR